MFIFEDEYVVPSYHQADYDIFEYYLEGNVTREELDCYYDDNNSTFKRMCKYFNVKEEDLL